ncbi:bifunctional protein-disulfide isomerase/oxidoreductase DsbC [Aliiglaciecola sp. LCG003]|uniref:bifunctional protein-disulfide isomerase/oxidoreductase DsbC n=1 Tax=Aliiglaciecola sp. LCG003 TaxID=3053655 RepID=UPI002573E462|nr:bifunctional protein-disulfide isomerase/oxidoreductase DsbC [Aliiglaciecola sp. LCG003]WJG10193.1 bifunctional protein-disulfide isomerase/oxidoreductase DsbC [Aliiglaciecola sp. LCG003]
MKVWIKLLALGVGLVSVVAVGQVTEGANDFTTAKQNLEKKLGFKVISVGDSPIAGLIQVATNRGLFYTDPEGSYLVSGKIYNVEKRMKDETEESLIAIRRQGLPKFNDSVIEYKAADEKYVVNVFTDITCGYCRKLHREMDSYNAKGITVRYLAFPRNGVMSPAYRDMVSVWCSANPQEALNSAKQGENVDSLNCTNDVAQQYEFGQSIGVSGTPNIILPNGEMVPGYQPPEALLQTLLNI